MADALKVIGQRLPRVDAHRKVTGKLLYYSDRSIPGMLYMKILRSPYAHAKITSINVSKALALPGVEAVLTHQDVPQVPISFPDNIFILQDRVFYVGCEVAAVAATSEEIAEEATRLIEVQYEELPVLLEVDDAIAPSAPEIHPGTPNLIFGMPILAEWGDIADGFAAADQTLEGTYTTQAVYNCGLENHGCIADWNKDDYVTIWCGTQSAWGIREAFAPALGVPMSKLRIVNCNLGGGFGGKTYTLRHYGIAALLSKKTGKPVKFTGSREDEFQRCNTRHATKFTFKTGFKQDGTLTALDAKVKWNTGAYFTDALGTAYVAIDATNIYPVPNCRWECDVAYTNRPNAGAFRGYGNLQATYALEIHFDRLIEQLGMDPIDWRLKNHINAGEIYGAGQILTSEAFDEVITRGSQTIDWQNKWKGYGKPYEVNGSKRKGVGMACSIHVGMYGYDQVVARIDQDGSAQVHVGVSDHGQGNDTIIAQIAAETLRMSFEKISVVSGDTQAATWGSPTVASRAAATTGKATLYACEDALKKLLELAAPLLGVGINDVDAAEGAVFVKASPGQKLTYQEVLAQVYPPVIIGSGRWGVPEAEAVQGTAAHFADIEVDTDTGEIKINKIVAAHDVGRVVNPSTCENQIEGALCSAGIGMAVYEDFVIDALTGKINNPNLSDYALPTAMETPEMQVIFEEPIDPVGPYGVKGVAEIPLNMIGPAVSNAVYNAIGVRITDYPITPAKVLAALNKV